MRHYHSPLYVSYGIADETEGLKQALSLARNNNAPLDVLVVSPEFPKEFPDYREKYAASLIAQVEASIRTTKEAIKLEEDAVETSLDLISDKTPSIKIIQYVLQHGYDLLIKEAESLGDSGSGFKALDMELLRKCPCAVWLCRPIAQSRWLSPLILLVRSRWLKTCQFACWNCRSHWLIAAVMNCKSFPVGIMSSNPSCATASG
jgi:universal stress protein E